MSGEGWGRAGPLVCTLLALTAPVRAQPSLAPAGPDPAPPPEATIALATSDPAPVIGLVAEVDLELTLPAEAATSAAASRPPRLPRLVASVGTVAALERTGERSFRARYRLPPERYPQVALLVAELERPGAAAGPLHGFLALPLPAPATPAFRTDPGAQVTVLVGEREFGPVLADAAGLARVPVVVPPGVSSGVARSVNAYGRATEQTVDLSPPPFRRLLVLAPPTLAAGETGEVLVAGVGPAGEPLPANSLALHGPGARPQALGGLPGLARFLVRAPSALTSRQLRLTAGVRGEASTMTEILVGLAPGPATQLVLRSERNRLLAGAQRPLDVFVLGRDRFGNPTPVTDVQVFVDRQGLAVRPLADGRVVAPVPAPPVGRSAPLVVEAVLPGAYGRHLLGVAGAARPGPAREARALTARLGLLLARGSTVGASLALDAFTRLPRLPRPLELGLSLGYLHRGLEAKDAYGAARVALDQGLLLALARWRWPLRQRLDLAPVAGAGLALFRGSSEHFGHTLVGRAWRAAYACGLELAAQLGPGAATLTGRYLYVPGGEVGGADRYLGNAAGVVFDLGYRVGL